MDRASELHLAAPTEDRRGQVLDAMRRSRSLHRPWVYPPVTDAGYARWLERQATDEFEGFLILRRSDDQLVGMCNLSQIVREPLQGAYIGFGAVEGFAGRGYMRAGVGLVSARRSGACACTGSRPTCSPTTKRRRASCERWASSARAFPSVT